MEVISFWNDLSWVLDLRTPFLNIFFDLVSLAGYPTFLILFLSFGYFFWSPEKFSRIAMLLFISGLINGFLKDYFQDPRPLIEFMLDPRIGQSYGWPSGHAQIAVTLWGLIAIEFKNNWLTTFCVLMIGLVSFSRIYLGVHDIGDVFAGLLIGTIILTVWQLATIYKFNDFLSNKLWIVIILLSQIIYYLSYPSHINHEPSAWFLGVMFGWYVFASKIEINKPDFVKIPVVLISTMLVFITMITINNINEAITIEGISGVLASYVLGIIFSFIVTWLIPKTWTKLKLV
tara:strand:+ start:5655 stop:6518 length:864 start_codon:yes stop_codon:yes gene_type:complete